MNFDIFLDAPSQKLLCRESNAKAIQYIPSSVRLVRRVSGRRRLVYRDQSRTKGLADISRVASKRAGS